MLYAHSKGDDQTQWQPLHEHLENVAELCSAFAEVFGYGQWGRALGLLHDAGKACDCFQNGRLFNKPNVHVDHAALGAKRALELYGGRGDELDQTYSQAYMGELIAYAILGHHRGMKNSLDIEERIKKLDKSSYSNNTAENYLSYKTLLEDYSATNPPNREDLESILLSRLMRTLEGKANDTFRQHLVFSSQAFTRMLFSCLVDADWLDTEHFVHPEKAEIRKYSYDSIPTLLDKLETHLNAIKKGAKVTAVNKARATVLDDCRKGANMAPGLFTLTVPTGGGKTLSSMEFALRHAAINNLQRIIYAIPFTSIVEQSAQTFLNIFGDQNVLEHHSNYDFEKAAEERREYERLAVQNWDAPIVVTTNVKLLESLFSNKPGKCRKLHNVANSVIVLDEAQVIPIELMKPTLAALEELTLDFGASVVLCTATQPAVEDEWPFGSHPHELCGAHEELFAKAFDNRVRYKIVGEIPEAKLAEELAMSRQSLCVVGKKAEALALYRDMVSCARDSGVIDEDVSPANAGFFHLSAHMVPAHRSQMIDSIQGRLTAGERCVVVSTQLIEAGVDVDFPVVWRELAGLDSVIQAAGRCNRNGRCVDGEGNRIPGDVFVFEFAEREGVFRRPDSQNFLGKTRSIAWELINKKGRNIDSESIALYFKNCYQSANLDKKCILENGSQGQRGLYEEMSSRNHLMPNKNLLSRYMDYLYDFETYARTYKVIEDSGEPIFVPWKAEGQKRLMRLREFEARKEEASLICDLQSYSVSVYPQLVRSLERDGLIERCGIVKVLRIEDDCRTVYSEEIGLLPPEEEVLNVMTL